MPDGVHGGGLRRHWRAPSPLAPSLAVLTLLSAIGPFTMNVMVPMMPALSKEFSTSYGVAQLTLTLYLVGTAVSTLALGALSDRFGRRPVMLAGLALYVAGTLFAAIAPGIELLLAARMLQALGGTAGLVLSRTILYDVHGRDRAASMIGYVTMAMVVAPMVAPAIGGLAVEAGHWRELFFAMSLVGAALLALGVLRLGETLPADVVGAPSRFSRANVARLVASRAFWGYTLNLSFASGIFFSFVAGAPYVVVNVLGLEASTYGLWFVLVSCGYMLGNFASARLSRRLGAETMVVGGSMVAFLAIATLWLLSGIASPLALFLPMSLVAISNGLTLPSSTASTMAVEPELAGTASGLSGAIQIGVGALVTVAVGAVLADDAFPMRISMTACAVLSLAGVSLALGPRRVLAILAQLRRPFQAP